MNQFDEVDATKYTSSYTRLDKQPSLSQISSTYHQKIEMLFKFLISTMGAFLFTFGIIASNDNFLGLLLIFFLTILMANKPNAFNPAVSMMEFFQGIIGSSELCVAIMGQFVGCMLGAMTGYFVLDDLVDRLPYLYASLDNGIIAQMYGEVFGSAILLIVILIQDDDYLKFTDDNIEHALLITATFGAARSLSYRSSSVFNPFIAFSLELFECLYDGDWSRMSMVWIFMIGPIMGAMIALIFTNQVYKNVYNQKIRNGI